MENSSINYKNKNFLLRFVTSYSIVLIIILLMGLYMYRMGIEEARINLYEQSFNALEQSVSETDSAFLIMDTLTSQIAHNSQISKLSSYYSSGDTAFYQTAANSMDLLKSFIPSETFLPIIDYYIYFPNNKYILSTNLFNDSDLFYRMNESYDTDYYESWLELMTNKDTYRKFVPLDKYAGKETHSFLYMLPLSTYTLSSRILGTVCFEVSQEKLEKMFSGLNLYDTGFIFVVDSNLNEVFTIKGKNSMEFSEADFISNINENNIEETSFYESKINGNPVIITSKTSKTNGWTYYLVQPEDMAFQYLVSYQNAYTIIIVLACLAGFAIIFFTSKKNVQPIIQINTELETSLIESNSLKETLELQRPIVYNSYISRIMNGRIDTQEELEYFVDFLDLNFVNRKFAVLYIILHSNEFDFPFATNSEESINPNNEDTYHELIRRLLYSYFGVNILIYEANSREFAVLLHSDQQVPIDSFLAQAREQFTALHSHLKNEYSIWTYAGLGNRNEDLMYTWKSYQQAIEATSYVSNENIFQRYANIIKDKTTYYYPLEFAHQLSNFILAGNEKQVKELMKLIHHENFKERTLSLPVVKWLLSDLRNTLLKIRFTISTDKDNEEFLAAIDSNLLGSKSFHILEETALQLCKFYERKPEGNKLIVSIQEYIKENYKDSSLSLSKISDEFHISESYFSYLFKAETKENFSEYLERIRMEQALHLLKSSTIAIGDLYLEVGYNNANSFRRAFKKIHGVSPRTIRENRI
ncbi:MAG: helix-turn-helix domain-containing protein [Clostridiales bacterium]|nr:helix-turn-helix domain-containing protein [Clostridiales bacterium]